MPEGDTIRRVADVMRRTLRDDRVVAARGRPGGAQLQRLVGSRTTRVSTRGKHLLVDFDNGLTLHTHMQMRGSWHRYRIGERWHAYPNDAVAVIETASAVAVCFEAPTVELLETRAIPLHPVLSQIGPDLLDEGFDLDEAVERVRAREEPIAEALLDQRAVAGIGNLYRSEVLFIEHADPFERAREVPREQVERLLSTAQHLLRANVGGGERVTMPDPMGAPPDASVAGSRNRGRWVYRRAGRPCRHCGTAIRSASVGKLPRRLYWCPTCQSDEGSR